MGMSIEIDEKMIEREVARQIDVRLSRLNITGLVENAVKVKVDEVITDEYIRKCADILCEIKVELNKKSLIDQTVDSATKDITSYVKQVFSNMEW